MEGRRVEGVFLDTAILRNRAHEAYETARVYEIRILSRVPEALLASLGDVGTRLRASVRGLREGKVLLMLENGYEVEAQNRLSMPVREGEELSLIVESKNPLTLRVERSFSGLRGVETLIHKLLSSGISLMRGEEPRVGIFNSGIFYERKVWDFLKGSLERSLLESDEKFKVLNVLMEADVSELEGILKNSRLPQDLRGEVGRLLSLLAEGRKADFFLGVLELRSRLSEALTQRESRIETLRNVIREVSSNLLNNLLKNLRELGFSLSVREEVLRGMETSPKSLDIIREALRGLEEGRTGEFVQRLKLLGIEIKNTEHLPVRGENLRKSLDSLIRGAVRTISSKTGVSDLQELSKEIRKLSEEVENIKDMSRRLSEIPPRLSENLSKLELIAHLQSFLIAMEGRNFVIPFGDEEERGLLGFSLRDAFRIFLRIDLGDGYLGAIIESPRKENPDRISLLFSTDREEVAGMIRRGLDSLKRELEELGLEVVRLEVLSRSKEDFEAEVGNFFGEEGTFNLRV